MSNTPPQLPEARVREILKDVLEKRVCALLGVRGYFRDTMGEPGRNDVGIYDDAIFFVAPGVFKAVRANTDPSRIGYSPSVGKFIAMLQPGLHYFIRGAHRGYTPALRQADEDQAKEFGIPNYGHVKVWRSKSLSQIADGTAPEDEGYFAINMHKGGWGTTSSLGCQTIHPDLYGDFMDAVWAETIRRAQRVIPYLLINGPVS